jgi:predicted O-methyltransferase YrrM
MQKHLREILEIGHSKDQNGKIYPLQAHISVEEGLFLQKIISEIKPAISIEVGMAMGISTMFICEELSKLKQKKHIIIDPGQTKLYSSGDGWNSIGLFNVDKCGYSDIIEFHDQPSEIALPILLKNEIKIDFAFIDGWHTFDHVLLDFFYINRMLKVGGIIVFDDSHFDSINKVINYISNYPCYKPFIISDDSQRNNGTKTSINKKIVQKSFHNPFSIPAKILRIINKIIRLRIERFSNKYIHNIEKNQKISLRYYAIQKISEDDRSWNWFKNF